MVRRIFVVAVLSASWLSMAQEPGVSTGMPVIQTRWDELRQYLVLSAGQLATLEQIQASRAKAEQEIYAQMHEKERQLHGLLQQGSNDSTAIGRLMVDINNLRRQLPLNPASYRAQALTALDDAQKSKLPALDEALTQQTPAWQAVQLNLLDNPSTRDIRILPYPMPAVGPAVSSEAVSMVR
jgi:Spy/CpxP family protein refolding chaperone